VIEVNVVVLSVFKGIVMRKTVVLVCTLSLLLSAAVLAGCGGGGGSSSSPEGVTKAFLAAAIKKDVDTTWDMLSQNTRASMKNKATLAETLKTFGPNDKVVIGKTTVTGDKAKSGSTTRAAGVRLQTKSQSSLSRRAAPGRSTSHS